MTDQTHVVCPVCGGVNRLLTVKLSNDPKCGKCHKPLFQGQPLALDEGGFTHHIQRSELPLLVDFWAPWCAPCRMMAPAFEEAARKLEPAVRLVKVNTEENQSLAIQYGIRSIPTLALFRAGEELNRVSGAMDTGGLISWVRKSL